MIPAEGSGSTRSAFSSWRAAIATGTSSSITTGSGSCTAASLPNPPPRAAPMAGRVAAGGWLRPDGRGSAIRFTVTPLGGARADTARVVDSIVRYLQPPPKAPPAGKAPPGRGSGPEEYYADRGEEPGRWLGRHAHGAGLTGVVERDDFASVLAGRDPRSGERLVTAQGSAGRRPSLGAGAHTKLGAGGERLYDPADAAAALGVSHPEVDRMLDIGTAVALATLATRRADGSPSRPTAPPAGDDDGPGSGPGRPPGGFPGGPVTRVFPQPGGSYLVPLVEPDGSRWVRAGELDRCAQARDAGLDPDELRYSVPRRISSPSPRPPGWSGSPASTCAVWPATTTSTGPRPTSRSPQDVTPAVPTWSPTGAPGASGWSPAGTSPSSSPGAGRPRSGSATTSR